MSFMEEFMNYTKKELKLFEENSEYVVMSNSPLKIKHNIDGSTANGTCAEYIIRDYLRRINYGK